MTSFPRSVYGNLKLARKIEFNYVWVSLPTDYHLEISGLTMSNVSFMCQMPKGDIEQTSNQIFVIG